MPHFRNVQLHVENTKQMTEQKINYYVKNVLKF
jgi:hypothetical protein